MIVRLIYDMTACIRMMHLIEKLKIVHNKRKRKWSYLKYVRLVNAGFFIVRSC